MATETVELDQQQGWQLLRELPAKARRDALRRLDVAIQRLTVMRLRMEDAAVGEAVITELTVILSEVSTARLLITDDLSTCKRPQAIQGRKRSS